MRPAARIAGLLSLLAHPARRPRTAAHSTLHLPSREALFITPSMSSLVAIPTPTPPRTPSPKPPSLDAMDVDPLPPTPPAVSKLMGFEAMAALRGRGSHLRGSSGGSDGADGDVDLLDADIDADEVVVYAPPGTSDFPYLNTAPGGRILFPPSESGRFTLDPPEDDLLFDLADPAAPGGAHVGILELEEPQLAERDTPTDADTLPPTPTTYDAPMVLPLPHEAEAKKEEGMPTPPPSPEAAEAEARARGGGKGVVWDLRVAAAGQPKNPRPRDRLPAICKEDCGEDAYFVHDGATSFSLGVADGVGGWTSLGVDPSLFAWDLMNCCREEAEAADARGGVDTAKLLADGYRRVVEEGRVEAGSSTACLMNLDKRTGTVRTTNLGDSGAIVIRPRPDPGPRASGTPDSLSPPSTTGSRASDASLSEFHVPFRTTDLQHYFNAPFQLSVLPPPMRSDPTNIVDSPSDAVSEHFGGEHGIREGDVVVLGTDGVWDNLWEEEIHARLQQALGGIGHGWEPHEEDGGFDVDADRGSTHGFVLGGGDGELAEIDRRLERVARQLCMDARLAARDARKPSPFSRNARKAGHLHFGGKLDDVTVILAYVARVPQPASEATQEPSPDGSVESSAAPSGAGSPTPSAPATPPSAKAGGASPHI